MIKNIFLFFLFFLLSMNAEKLKMYVMYTDSHEKMMRDYLLPSIKDDFELIIEKHDQRSETGQYGTNGYNDTTKDKVKFILRAIEDNWGKIFIFSDADIIFLNKFGHLIPQIIKNKDIVFQVNNLLSRTLCSGFFVCRANQITKGLFIEALETMNKNPKFHDQDALFHLLIRNKKKYSINWGLLPLSFWHIGINNGEVWNPGTDFDVPKNLIICHATYVLGVENKCKFLNYVLGKYE